MVRHTRRQACEDSTSTLIEEIPLEQVESIPQAQYQQDFLGVVFRK